MKKKIMAVLLLLTLSLCSCGPIHQEDSSSEAPHITVYFTDSSPAATDSSINENDSSEINKEIADSIYSQMQATAPAITTTVVTKKPENVEATTTVTTTQQIGFTDISKKSYVAKQYITFYYSPSTTSDIRMYIRKDEELIIKGISSDSKWYSITYKNWNGYVLISDTTDEKPIVKATTITTQITTPAAQQTTTTTVSTGYRLPYVLSENEWWWICKVVCSETGYCGEKQQKAVANTIFNRLIWAAKYGNNNPFPTTAIAVVQQPGQYDAYKYWRSDTRLHPGGSLWNQTMRYIKEAASEPDFTNGAIGYYNPSMSGYLSAFENNKALILAYVDGAGRFFRLNPACYTQK